MILGDDDQIGAQIRQWRINIGLTIAEACRESGVTPSVWTRIETGETPNPLHRTVMRMFLGMGAMIEAKLAPSSGQATPREEQLPLKMSKPRRDGRIHADA